jgi:hypothetical protein
MKNLVGGAPHRKRQPLANLVFYGATLVMVTILFAGCQKETVRTSETSGDETQSVDDQSMNKHSAIPEGEIARRRGISFRTIWELRQARFATAKYRDINNAIHDGYSNINVDVENMGHHFMNMNLVDGTFDIRKPEILVYNGLETGHPKLVAVEYAIPLTDPKPEGFTGSADVWNGDSGFPYWLLHAWVWEFNPDGVFNWTNPRIDLD